MGRSLLLCFAHPDDESFFAAGAICKYRSAGFNVVLCCATRGERGTAGNPPLCTIDELPSLREQELRSAAAILGIHTLKILPYQDQQLAHAPAGEVTASLVHLIRRHKPQVVITFDRTGGGSGHPDHIAISRFTYDAVLAAADERYRPEVEAPHAVSRIVWTGVAPWKLSDRTAIAARPDVDLILDTAAWRDKKEQALLAHRTQAENVERLFKHADAAAILSTESFRFAWGVPLPHRPADDVFAGL
jgi:N-acetylglucosamine malate deacetylase 2